MLESLHNALKIYQKQQQNPRRQQTSVFNAYLKNNYGGQHFVMGLWQMGMTWIPSKEMIATDKNGALEHVRQHFTKWIGRLARAFREH